MVIGSIPVTTSGCGQTAEEPHCGLHVLLVNCSETSDWLTIGHRDGAFAILWTDYNKQALYKRRLSRMQ